MERLAWLLAALAMSSIACDAEDSDIGACEEGSEGCACYPNGSCDSGLTCLDDHTCSDKDGSGGSSGASGGGSGGSSSGETVTSGGSTSGATGGAGGTDGRGGASTQTSGGAGGTVSTGGSTTTESASTTSATGGTGGTAGEMRTAITPIDGSVDHASNDVGIQGTWYTYGEGVSTIVPAAEPFFDGQGTELCVSGTIPPHMNQGRSWGVGLGMELNAEDDVSSAYDATAFGVVGIRFTVTGDLPPTLQINFPMATDPKGTAYCRRYEGIAASQQTLTTYFNQAEFDCWEVEVTSPAPDPTVLRAFQIALIASANDTVSFDFCVEDIEAILE